MMKRTALSAKAGMQAARRGARSPRFLLYRAMPVLILLVVLAGCSSTASPGAVYFGITFAAAALFIANVFLQLANDPTTVWVSWP